MPREINRKSELRELKLLPSHLKRIIGPGNSLYFIGCIMLSLAGCGSRDIDKEPQIDTREGFPKLFTSMVPENTNIHFVNVLPVHFRYSVEIKLDKRPPKD